MKATIDWAGNASFKATSGTGHTVQMGGPPDHGGENLGPRPMELLIESHRSLTPVHRGARRTGS